MGNPCRMKESLTVLMSAYACEPGKGSEPEVGWRVATTMAACCRVRVVTRTNNRATIEAGLADIAGPRPEFLYYDLPAWCRWLKKRGLGVAWYYLLWQIGVRGFVRRHLDGVDLIHHVTFNGVQLPGCWHRERVPVVLGPLGGGMICPPDYLPLFGRGRFGEAVRGFMVKRLHWLAGWRAILSDAAVVLAANRESADLIQPLRRDPVPVMLETAVAREAIAASPPLRSGGAPLRLLWLGNLIPRKAAILAVEAMARALQARDDLRLVIAGAGPEEQRLRERVDQLGVGASITFAGRVPKAEVKALMDGSDAFLFTSVRDTSGNVVLEAMSRGLPVVVLDHQGMREICDESSALRVEPGPLEATIEGLARAILELAGNDALRQRLGDAARQRVAEVLTWDRFRERMLDFYRLALRDRSAPHG
jgi:glycosyltransferase involved in cell wall biosynthesis